MQHSVALKRSASSIHQQAIKRIDQYTLRYSQYPAYLHNHKHIQGDFFNYRHTHHVQRSRPIDAPFCKQLCIGSKTGPIFLHNKTAASIINNLMCRSLRYFLLICLENWARKFQNNSLVRKKFSIRALNVIKTLSIPHMNGHWSTHLTDQLCRRIKVSVNSHK
jgi:hypothetical protein